MSKEQARRGAPPKPPAECKSNVIQIRLTDAEKADCTAAADVAGVKLATWARESLVRAARRKLKSG